MYRLIFILFFILPHSLLAQQYNFNTWSVEHGLPQSQVYDILQSRRGNLWLATLGGVSRFDGVSFATFTKTHGLSSNSIKTIYQDTNGLLWFGTLDAGLCLYDGVKIKCYGPADGIPEGGVYDITQDLKGNLIITTDAGLRVMQQNRFVPFAKSAGLPDQKYWAILADKKGNIWVTTLADGVYRYDGKTVTHFTTKDGLRNDITYSAFEDVKGTIWFGHYGGLSKFDGSRFSYYKFGPSNNINRIWDICTDKAGTMWLAMDGGGVVMFDGKNFTRITEKNGLSSNFINSIERDKEGNIWFGTMGGGLQQFTSQRFIHYQQPDGLVNQNITAIAPDKSGKKWIGTLDGGAALFDGKTFKWYTSDNGLGHNIVNDIKTAPNGTVWFATNGGISSYNGKEFRTLTTDHGLPYIVVSYCLPDSGNSIWLGTHKGLSFYNGQTFTNYLHPELRLYNNINTVFKDNRNRLWLGTDGGLALLENGEIKDVNYRGEPLLKNVNAIVQDKDGTLWLGSYGNGLVAYRPDNPEKNKQVTRYTLNNGLLSEEINSLLIDNRQQLWAGTIKGLSRLSLPALAANPNNPKFKNYTYQQGFRGIEATHNAVLEDENGAIWFGTIKGLTCYKPGQDKSITHSPVLALRNIRLFLQDVNWEDEGKELEPKTTLPKNLELTYQQNYLTFDYHATSLTNPDGVRYSFKLDGFDKRWSAPTTATSATYSNLEPGTYTFAVRAMNSDGVWNKQPLTYKFEITPPIWNNLWFMGLMFSLAVAGVFSLVRIRENNYKKLNTILEQKVDLRTKMLEEKNREKEVLIKEIHHRVKNNLQIITSMLNLQARYIKDPQALQVVREVKDRVKAMSTIHQRLYRRDELADLDFASYISGLCKSLFISYGISEQQVKLDCNIPQVKLDIDTAVTLGLIINEVISNTLKYAFPNGRKGTLLVDLIPLSQDLYQLTIADDGVGLPPDFEEKKQYSFGLQLISSLSRKLDGKLNFYTENGTQVKLIFHTFS